MMSALQQSCCSPSWKPRDVLCGAREALSAGFPSRPGPMAGAHVAAQGWAATPRATRRLEVKCMANPRRVQMVAQQIRREVSEMLLFDKVVKDALTPEHALGADRYLSSIATVSDVEVSGDLQVAKVYVSVYGDARGQEQALAGLQSVTGYVRKGLGRRMRLRFTPEVRFIHDEAMERGSRVLSILSQLEKERKAKENGEAVPRLPMLESEADEDEDELLADFADLGSMDGEQQGRNPQREKNSQGNAGGEKSLKEQRSANQGGIYYL